MRRYQKTLALVVGGFVAGAHVGAAQVVVSGSGADQAAQVENAVVGHSVSTSATGGTLRFDLADGTDVRIAFERGRILLHRETIARYSTQGEIGTSWRAFLARANELTTAEVVEALEEFAIAGASNDADLLAVQEQIRETARALRIGTAPAVVAGRAVTRVVVPDVAIPNIEVVVPSMEVPSVQVDIDPVIAGDIRTVGSRSIVGTVAGNVLSLVASLVALTFIGFGYLFFVPRQFSQVADTAWHSFGRSFLTGLFAQPLIIPALGAMIVGLALTVVGIIVIPFALLAFAAALVVSITGGYLAIARSVGEIYVRRRGTVDVMQPGWMELKYLVVGLTGLLAIWLPAAFLGWVPGVGMLFTVLAAILTWIIATAGLGASILSRGGIRGTIVRRLDYALTDQRLWDTAPSITTTTARSTGAR